jgi:hypothetical protein
MSAPDLVISLNFGNSDEGTLCEWPPTTLSMMRLLCQRLLETKRVRTLAVKCYLITTGR